MLGDEGTSKQWLVTEVLVDKLKNWDSSFSGVGGNPIAED